MNSNKSSYIVGLILIIISVIGYYTAVEPFWTESQTLENQKEISLKQEEGIKKKIENYKKLEADLNQVSEVKQETGINAIPDAYNQDTIITSLVEKAEEHKMIVSSVNFGEGVETELGVKAANITMSLQGDYQKLIAFLRSIESEIQRKVVIKNIGVELGESLGSLQEISFSLSMEIYYQ